MKPPSTPADAGESRRLLIGLLFPSLCVLVAFGTVSAINRNNKSTWTVVPRVEGFTPTEILNRLPKPDVSSTTGMALAAAISKTREFPDQAGYWVQTGEALAQLQRDSGKTRYYDDAESAYREALRLEPHRTDALTGMAWVTGGKHQFDKSVEWANQALAADPDNADAYGILGDAALELGEYDSAFEHYEKMMALRPDLSSWSRGAHLLWVTGNKSRAMWLMNKAINAGAPFAENTAWCRAQLATMLFHDGALPPAEKTLQPAFDAGMRHPQLLLIAARIATAKGDFTTAENHYRTLLKAGPDQQAYAGLGDLSAARGDLETAENFYQKVESLHASHLEIGIHDHAFMEKFLADHNRNLVEALRMAEEHKLSKNVREADTLAWVYYKNDMLPEAVKAMKKALAQNTPDAEIHYHAGLIAAASRDFTSAKKHLEQALSINPNFSLIQAPIALKTLEQLGDMKALSQTGPENNH